VGITFSRNQPPPGRLNLSFITEGKLAAIFIKTFSWGFPTGRSLYFIKSAPIKELSLLEMIAKRVENLQLWVVPPENRVFGQYIVLEASPGPSDLKPWIQGLLGTSRTFMVTPRNIHKSPNSWLGQIDLIRQEFESITSSTFDIPKLLMYL
jgi:hypothetical protein